MEQNVKELVKNLISRSDLIESYNLTRSEFQEKINKHQAYFQELIKADIEGFKEFEDKIKKESEVLAQEYKDLKELVKDLL